MTRLILCLLLLVTDSNQADFILKKSDSSRFATRNSKIEVLLELYADGSLVSKERLDVYNKGRNKSLVKFLDKKRNGQLVLSVGKNLWVYFPRTRKPIRITPIQRIMGQASNGDIARLSYSTDYDAVLLREENFMGKDCYVLKLDAKSRSSTYRKIIYWISKGDHLPRKAEYYLISGKHFKTATFEDYRQFGDRKLVGLIRYQGVGSKNETVMRFLNYSEQSIPDKYFHKNYLSRVRL